jgi:peptidoglycan/xylan/chitin deacetylase (PgdA/CDA1 family)
VHEDGHELASLEWYLHPPASVFAGICSMLARKFRVISLAEVIDAQARGLSLPANAVVLTFDDGFASNFHLVFPILKQHELPATLFVATGFLDGTDMLWFQRVDAALRRTHRPSLDWTVNGRRLNLGFASATERMDSHGRLMPELKKLPHAVLLEEVARLEEALEVPPLRQDDLPPEMRPMNWNMAREMVASGLIEVGGHTHTHPILARCDAKAMREEIHTCRNRIAEELGRAPVSFAYPNGRPGDFTAETVACVHEAGFKAACTTMQGRVDAQAALLQMPRFDAPPSAAETEVVASGVLDICNRRDNKGSSESA